MSETPGVREVRLTVPRPQENVPALLWLPGRTVARRPLVLLAHGGGMHKESPFIARLGRRLAAELGYAALAIDLPLHGERTPPEEAGLSGPQRRTRMGDDAWRARNSAATSQAVADWRAAIDLASGAEPVAAGPACSARPTRPCT